MFMDVRSCSRCEESEGAVYLSDRVWLVGAVGTGC